MNRNLLIGIIVLLAIITGAFLFGSSQEGSQAENKFFDLNLVNYEGNSISLEEFKGRPLVINSWAVWCPFCRKELSDFAELQKEFGDSIVVIAVDRQESLEKAKGYTDNLGITNDILFLLDLNDSFYKSIGGFSMPETIFVNAEGEIVVHKRGPMELDEMREHVNKII